VKRLLLALALAACEVAPRPGSGEVACTCEADARAVDPSLLSFLSKARAAHHKADAAETTDRAQALAALETIVAGPRPPRRPEVDEVLADTRARMAELHAAQGQFDQAANDVQLGLELARDISYFRGHLFEVLGVVEEQRAASLAASDPAAAEQARRRAIRASEQAIDIQTQVLTRALEQEKK